MKTRLILPIVFAFAFPHLVMPVDAQVVPGTGQQIVEVFDNFEDPNWSFTLNLPKSSANIDKVERHPSGFAANRLFLESMYRGTPDFVRRVETPPGGIPGSTGSLAMQTLNSGIPGELSHTFQQDDLIAGVQTTLGYMMPVSWTPSYVTRVYIPAFDKWERRHGSHFGFRADCTTTIDKPNLKGRFFKNLGTHRAQEQYWPGFFIQLNLKNMTGQPEDFATLVIRGDDRGHEVPGPKITHEGWWTLGMTFTPDGKVHYYAHEGVGDLTARDHIYSGFPYGYRCEQTSTYFYNIVNQDDGKSWSTRWIVDDPKVYVASGSYRPKPQQQTAQNPAAPAQPQAAAAVAQKPSVQPPALQQPTAPVAQGQMPAAKPAQVTAPTAPVAVAKPTIASAAAPVVAPAPKTPTPASVAAPTVTANAAPIVTAKPAIPQLASKPTEVQAPAKVEPAKEAPAKEVPAKDAPATEAPATAPANDAAKETPPKEVPAEVPATAPATLPEQPAESPKPAPVVPPAEEPSAGVTPSSLETPGEEEAPIAPAPPPNPE